VADQHPAPHPLGRSDAAALIGVTAVLQGYLLIGELVPDLVDALNRRLHRAGLVGSDAGPAELRLALGDLTDRIRYALGEYDEPPAPGTGETRQHFGFVSETEAQAFARAAIEDGESAAPPEAVDGRAYDGHVGWQVAVRVAELPLSDGFDRHVARLRELAARHGGSYGGWATATAS
jgi:Regulator of ribonuclease activity B